MGKSIAQRYAELDRRADVLAGNPLGPAPSPVHVETVAVMRDLLNMANSFNTGPVPAHLRTMLRIMEHSEPMLVEQLSTVPPATIQAFMRELRDRMDRIITADTDEPAAS